MTQMPKNCLVKILHFIFPLFFDRFKLFSYTILCCSYLNSSFLKYVSVFKRLPPYQAASPGLPGFAVAELPTHRLLHETWTSFSYHLKARTLNRSSLPCDDGLSAFHATCPSKTNCLRVHLPMSFSHDLFQRF